MPSHMPNRPSIASAPHLARSAAPRRRRPAALDRPPRQAGAALFTSLVLLLVMTVLGLSSMNTNILEERMAANSQEGHRAFRAAESLVETLFASTDPEVINLSNTANAPYVYQLTNTERGDYGIYVKDLSYQVYHRQQTAPTRGSGWDSTYAFYHFDTQANAETLGNAASTVHAGLYQVGKK